MNTLTTRKIVLGMLLVLVLAFSVQGTADAQTITESSGDRQNQSPGLAFNSPLVFTVSGVKADNTQNPNDLLSSTTPPTPPTISAPSNNYITITITGIGGISINNVTISNKSAITSTTLNQPRVFSTAINTAGAAYDADKATAINTGLNNYNNADTTLGVGNNTISVACTANTAGVSMVTISQGGTAQHVFTLYVSAAPSSALADFSPASTLSDPQNVVTGSAEGEISVGTTDTNAGNLVDFTVISGSGTLYFDGDDRNRAQGKQTVGIDAARGNAAIRFKPPGSGVTVVEAWLRFTNKRTRWTFFSVSPTLVKVEDVAGRTGVVGTRLSDPFVIEVRDGQNGARVPHQEVEFSVSGPATNTMLVSAADSTKKDASTLALQSDPQGRGRSLFNIRKGHYKPSAWYRYGHSN